MKEEKRFQEFEDLNFNEDFSVEEQIVEVVETSRQKSSKKETKNIKREENSVQKKEEEKKATYKNPKVEEAKEKWLYSLLYFFINAIIAAPSFYYIYEYKSYYYTEDTFLGISFDAWHANWTWYFLLVVFIITAIMAIIKYYEIKENYSNYKVLKNNSK